MRTMTKRLAVTIQCGRVRNATGFSLRASTCRYKLISPQSERACSGLPPAWPSGSVYDGAKHTTAGDNRCPQHRRIFSDHGRSSGRPCKPYFQISAQVARGRSFFRILPEQFGVVSYFGTASSRLHSKAWRGGLRARVKIDAAARVAANRFRNLEWPSSPL